MYRGRFRTAVYGGDLDEYVFDIGLGVFNKNIEVPVLRKNASVEKLEFGFLAAAPPVFLDEAGIGKFRMRIFVKHAHVTVSGSRVLIEVILLHILAVIALVSREAKEPFFKDGIAAVP